MNSEAKGSSRYDSETAELQAEGVMSAAAGGRKVESSTNRRERAASESVERMASSGVGGGQKDEDDEGNELDWDENRRGKEAMGTEKCGKGIRTKQVGRWLS